MLSRLSTKHLIYDSIYVFRYKHLIYDSIYVFRYKLEIQVTDGKKVANFMLWDQDCINLIGLSAGDLRKKMIKVVHFYFSISNIIVA